MLYALPVLCALIWAGSNVVNRMAAGAIDPAAISFYRWLTALIVLTPFAARGVWRHRALVAEHFWRLAILGALGMAAYQSLAYYAARTVTATSMGLILGAMPIMTIVLAAAVFRSRTSPTVWVGALTSLVGLILLISGGDPAALLRHGIGLGELLMLAASFSYAVYNVLLKRWALPLPTWVSLYVQILVGLAILLPPFLLAPSVEITARNAPLILYAGLFASALAPGLWNWTLPRLGAERIAVFMNLSPLFTALLAIVMLGERLGPRDLAGGGLIIAGVVLAQSRRRKADATEPAPA
jgi:drug/metabolite transporter (DMT)-like permease